ncbi:MAG: hypothetical protein ACI9XO_004264 [Paraglaciecola sp.]|jgi:hypothetical protein
MVIFENHHVLTSKERETNNYRFLTGYFASIVHFKSTHYININRTFKAKNENKISRSRN